ncbi:Uncharacterised protein [Phocoenobacter uteri]|uniref:Uncharacterized protein n=1 Tax=Phocoenobacter uteri TaxID=146806 RepID=A0A379DEM9_9PAST|nr:hypothetical protein [Phocoenobacter uteri]MDG6882802.1 hypothetical protein [Phocoenobacter uteri]MDG6882841.1 hypothetical protein [Phocoenobacter uteri]SUB76414.1 Uncharacterised protein [Phocoenobacter uteri]
MKKEAKRTTYNVTKKRKDRLEMLAIRASIKANRTIKWTEIVSHAIDYYAEDSVADIVHKLH